MPSNPARNNLCYWNKKIPIHDAKQMDPKLGPTQIGKNNYYGRKINRGERVEIVIKKILPVLFISVVLAPVAIPCLFAFTDVYRKIGRWIREVHYGRKLECINNIARQALQSKSTSKSVSHKVNLDSNHIPLEILDLVFSNPPYFNNEKEVRKYFATLSLVCKPWKSRVEKAMLNALNAGKISFIKMPRLGTKDSVLSYIKANAEQLLYINLIFYKMTNHDLLKIAICKNLKKLVVGGAGIGDNILLFKTLKSLTIQDSSKLNITALNFPLLEELNICSLEDREIPRLGLLPKLKKLQISENDFLQDLPSLDFLTQLESLEISFNRYLEAIPSLNNLTQLKNLEIYENPSLAILPGLNSLINLKILWIDSDKIQSLPSFNSLMELEKLTISECKSLLALPSFEFLSKLKNLEIKYNPVLQSIPSFLGLVNLEELWIRDNKSLVEISSLEGLTRLQFLWIGDNESLPAIPPMEDLINLSTLYITNNNSLEKIPSLEMLTQLKSLDIDNPSLKEIPSLDHLNVIHEVSDPIQFNPESLCQQI